MLIFPLEPDGAPLGLNWTQVSDRSLSLSWDAPAYYSRNGIILNYTVSYNTTMMENKTISTNQTSVVVEDLLPNFNYTFAIQAVNEIGSGPPAYIVGKTLKGQKVNV